MNRLRQFDLSWGILLVLSWVCISGCDDGLPRRVPVSGRVLIDGKPLEQGSIQVFPKGQRAAYGTIGPGGNFTLTTFSKDDGCVLGKHPVTVTANQRFGGDLKWYVPIKYTKTASSGLEIDVPGPRNDVEIKLTWGGKKRFSDNEIIVKMVREFFEALIAKDYAKAGKLYSRIPAARLEKQLGNIKFLRIVTIGEPVSDEKFGSMRVPCKIEVEKHGKKSIMEPQGPFMWPVPGQPDRWQIVGFFADPN